VDTGSEGDVSSGMRFVMTDKTAMTNLLLVMNQRKLQGSVWTEDEWRLATAIGEMLIAEAKFTEAIHLRRLKDLGDG
jgi:hypothetical protein